ncbi:MAG: hypothetical protein N2688_03540 [Burkholderiaceae bacterium]|nr:hypothetical protein [Burkholderiaceae bacterium]
MRPARRLLLLTLLAAAGAAVGAIGQAMSGSAWWFLAVPAAVAAGWLALADPTRCKGGAPRRMR